MLERRASLALVCALLAAAACSDATSDGSPVDNGGSDTNNDGNDKGGTANGTTSGTTPKPSGGTTSGSGSTSGTTSPDGGSNGGTSAGTTTGTAGGDTTVPSGPTTKAISAVAGPATFDLSSAVPALAGAKITATMSVAAPSLGNGNKGSVTLVDLRVTTGAGSGLQLYRPVVVLNVGGKEISTQIGTDMNLQVPAGRVSPLKTTVASGDGWDTGATIKLRFSALMSATPAGIVGLTDYSECKSMTTFATWANLAQNSCATCHSIPLTFLKDDAKTACGQTRYLLADGAGKQSLTPGDNHANRTPNGYVAALNNWKSAEAN